MHHNITVILCYCQVLLEANKEDSIWKQNKRWKKPDMNKKNKTHLRELAFVSGFTGQ